MRSTSIPAALALTLALALWSSAAEAQQAARPPACTSTEHHQFDFWIGDWDVTLPNGKYAGTNRIEPILTGCVLRESWSGARGMHGTSYNIYDAAHRRWHQTWVDDGGNLLQLDGAFQDGKMVLIGEQKSDSATTLQRITWTPNGQGSAAGLGHEHRRGKDLVGGVRRYLPEEDLTSRPSGRLPPNAKPPSSLEHSAAVLWGTGLAKPGPMLGLA